MIEELSGKSLNLEQRPPRVGDVRHTLADISAARRELGYNPTTNFLEQLQIMADWYANHYPTT
jgi:nucleoside-diphosphate-sugar epimerase